jgi:cytochrome c oxidase subunit 2
MEEAQNIVQSPETKRSMTSSIVVVAVIILLVGGGIFALMQKSATPKQESVVEGTKTISSITNIPTVVPTVSSSASAEKEFIIVGQNYSFSPNQITVKKGDKVKITFTDEGGFHNLVIDGYNEKTETIRTGNSAVIAFTADKAGTFAFYCSVANHREQGMQGSLVVTE